MSIPVAASARTVLAVKDRLACPVVGDGMKPCGDSLAANHRAPWSAAVVCGKLVDVPGDDTDDDGAMTGVAAVAVAGPAARPTATPVIAPSSSVSSPGTST